MPSTHWGKFYWSDWSSDPALRVCSLAAQGLWMRMLCVAAEAKPVGHVRINGHALSVADIARLAGVSASEVTDLLDELDRNGVFSRTEAGVIYSRRMVADAERSAAQKDHGKAGGNPEIRRGTVPKEERTRPFKRTDSPTKTRRIFDRGEGKCHWCGTGLAWGGELAENTFHVDHVIAVCDGGTSDEDNLVAACARCNHARARMDRTDSNSGRGVAVGNGVTDTNPTITSDTNPDTNPSRARVPQARKKEITTTVGTTAAGAQEGIPQQDLGSSSSSLAAYTDAELVTLQTEFGAIDVAALIPELLAWCAGKGIHPLEQKSAVYGALQQRQAKAEVAARARAPPPQIAVSDALRASLQRRRA